MSTLADYQDRYRNMRFERRDGILQISLHTEGGPMKWGADAGAIPAWPPTAAGTGRRPAAKARQQAAGSGADL